MTTISSITGQAASGLTIIAPDGRPATLAIIDADGRVIESGPAVVRAVWNVVIEAYRNYWRGMGWLKVRAPAPERPLAKTHAEFRAEMSGEAAA